jgi:hypothetical protein
LPVATDNLATSADSLRRGLDSCEHTFVSSATDAFLERLLELLPIYYEAGREIARLAPPVDDTSAVDLARVACRRWLLDAIPADADAMRPVAAELAAAGAPAALIDFARDAAALAGSLGDAALAVTARHAESAARAAAEGRDADAGRAAADCLYSCRAAGTADVAAEAAVATGAANADG